MASIIDLIRVMLENDIVRTAFTYYLVGIALWLVCIFIILNTKLNNRCCRLSIDENCRLSCFLAIVFAFIVLIRALSYVGFLPYGPDTAAYTRAVKTISMTGHWLALGYDPYYAPYHTSACLLTIVTEILGSIQVAYFGLLAAFLLSFLLILGGWASKIASVNSKCLGIVVITFLFIASPNLRGFDLLQQYVGLVYAAISVMILLVQSRSIETYLTFLLFAVISVISHLSCVLLVSILLVAVLFLRRHEFVLGSFAFIAIIAAYLLVFILNATTAPKITTPATAGATTVPHMTTLPILLGKLLHGNPSNFVIRALNEIPLAKIALFSWVLLPSMASAYILLFLLSRIGGRRLKTLTHKTLTHNLSFISGKGLSGEFIVVLSVIALGYIFFGLLTKATGIDLLRYMAVPSYFILVILISVIVTRFLAKNGVCTLGLIIFLLFLSPYLYSAMHSNERVPWMGEIRLAPVTYTDRVEMLSLVRYAEDGYYIYCWHDAYLPLEEVENPPRLFGGGSYYPIHSILKMVARDKAVKVPANSLFVLHKNATNFINFKNYIVIFNGYQHFIISLRT